jgi:hypothetical protein
LTGPAHSTIAVALVRSFAMAPISDKARLDFRIEGFNALNHANFDIPAPAQTQIFTATSVIEDAGRITSAAPSRELQIGLRLAF